jgi:hypothetical protein
MLQAWDYWKPYDYEMKGPPKEPLPLREMLSFSK